MLSWVVLRDLQGLAAMELDKKHRDPKDSRVRRGLRLGRWGKELLFLGSGLGILEFGMVDGLQEIMLHDDDCI